jgi:hypothetical protein
MTAYCCSSELGTYVSFLTFVFEIHLPAGRLKFEVQFRVGVEIFVLVSGTLSVVPGVIMTTPLRLLSSSRIKMKVALCTLVEAQWGSWDVTLPMLNKVTPRPLYPWKRHCSCLYVCYHSYVLITRFLLVLKTIESTFLSNASLFSKERWFFESLKASSACP